MTSRDFCYWLQGFFELADPKDILTIEQKHVIKNHLAMVFKHEIDPSFGDKHKQEELAKTHAGQIPEFLKKPPSGGGGTDGGGSTGGSGGMTGGGGGILPSGGGGGAGSFGNPDGMAYNC